MSCRIRADEHRVSAGGLAGAHAGMKNRILLNYTRIANAHKVGEGGVQSILFCTFQPLLLCFKSKQAQNLSHNTATLYTQYHTKV